MCGIVGIFGQEAGHDSVLRELDSLRHRGSEEPEVESGPGWAIGVRRLPITSPTEAQPVPRNEAGNIVAVMNGEIYNYGPLRDQLVRLGHRFQSDTDTEVIVHAYEEWGPQFPSALVGMYAIILYDSTRHAWLVARDHAGIKPLYTVATSDSLHFASEIKALTKQGDVYEVPPGVVCYEGRTVKHSFFTHVATRVASDPAQDLLFILRRVVRDHVSTNEPIAVFLSGGVDSALLLRLATESHNSVTAITVGEPGSPDATAAKSLCQDLGLHHLYCPISQRDIARYYRSSVA